MINVIKFLSSVTILYGMFLLGNGIQSYFGLFIPGSVIGMILLFFLLQFMKEKLDWFIDGSQPVLKHLTIFFIPVTVGFIDYLSLFSGRGFILLLIALVSTFLVMGLSGAVSEWVLRRREERS